MCHVFAHIFLLGKLYSNENEKTGALCINMDKFYSVGSEEAVVEEYSQTVCYLYKCYLKCKTLLYIVWGYSCMIKGKNGTIINSHCFLVNKGEEWEWGDTYKGSTFYLGWKCIDIWNFLFYYVSLYFEVFL